MMEQFDSMRVPGHFYGPLNFHYTLAIGISYGHCYGTLSAVGDRHCRLSKAKVEEGMGPRCINGLVTLGHMAKQGAKRHSE